MALRSAQELPKSLLSNLGVKHSGWRMRPRLSQEVPAKSAIDIPETMRSFITLLPPPFSVRAVLPTCEPPRQQPKHFHRSRTPPPISSVMHLSLHHQKCLLGASSEGYRRYFHRRSLLQMRCWGVFARQEYGNRCRLLVALLQQSWYQLKLVIVLRLQLMVLLNVDA